MKDKSSIEIAIPVYNGGPFLAECLQSLLDQTHRQWNAVVVNNCSTDDTGEVAEEFSRRDGRIRVVHCADFLGQSENYNRAISQLTGQTDYIKLLEADNWMMPDCLERTLEVAEKNPQVGVVGSYWLRGLYVGGSGLPYSAKVLTGAEVCRLFFRHNVYLLGTPSTLLFRRKALLAEATWFRPGLYYDDMELCVRILRHWRFGYVHQVLAFIRDDNNGLYSTVRQQDDEKALRYFLAREYGGEWFEPDELRGIQRSCRREYFERLGVALLVGRNDAYWDLHRRLWRCHGSQLRKMDFIVPIMCALLKRALNPLTTVSNWQRRRFRREHQPSIPEISICANSQPARNPGETRI